MKYRFGITGDIASGKSTLSRFLMDMGFKVLDADLVSRELMEEGGEGYRKVKEVFPQAFSQGGLDRAKLAAIIFSDPKKRRLLDEILHPLIISTMLERAGQGVSFHDGSLLFEAGMDSYLDDIIFISIDEDLQLERLMKRDGLSEEEARKRMSSFDYPREEKLKRSYVIDNSGSVEDLKEKALVFLKKYGLVQDFSLDK